MTSYTESNLEPMISYAQNGEDVLIRRLFPDKKDGFYIDVGAYHPTIDSVTKYFYEKGWRGINIEPIESIYHLLEQERPRDINLNVAVSDTAGVATFHEISEFLGWSSLNNVVVLKAQE
ncbi:MAG: FkbM family methyltransferase, partial [Gammaproteobacteria bacterium]